MPTITPDYFTNFATSTLGGGGSGIGTPLLSADTSMVVGSGDGTKFPSSTPFMVLIGTTSLTPELVKCTARTGDTLTITRSQESTTAPTSWPVGTLILHTITAGNLSNMWTQLNTAANNFSVPANQVLAGTFVAGVLLPGTQLTGARIELTTLRADPANDVLLGIKGSSTANTLDLVGGTSGWRLIANSGSAYTSVWTVDQTGSLNTGIVPLARLTGSGAVPSGWTVAASNLLNTGTQTLPSAWRLPASQLTVGYIAWTGVDQTQTLDSYTAGGLTSGQTWILSDSLVTGDTTSRLRMQINGSDGYFRLLASAGGASVTAQLTAGAAGWTIPQNLTVQSDLSLTSTVPIPTTTSFAGAAVSGAGLSIGVYKYVMTYVGNVGETLQSNFMTVTTTAGNQKVNVSGITTSGDARVTSRKLYRTAVGGNTYGLVTTIADNTTSVYTDTTADGSLGAAPPAHPNLGGSLTIPSATTLYGDGAISTDNGSITSSGTGNLTIGGTLGVTGALTASSTLGVTSTLTVTGSTSLDNTKLTTDGSGNFTKIGNQAANGLGVPVVVASGTVTLANTTQQTVCTYTTAVAGLYRASGYFRCSNTGAVSMTAGVSTFTDVSTSVTYYFNINSLATQQVNAYAAANGSFYPLLTFSFYVPASKAITCIFRDATGTPTDVAFMAIERVY